MRLMLLNAGMDIQASKDAKYAFVISVASGRADMDAILNWIRKHLVAI